MIYYRIKQSAQWLVNVTALCYTMININLLDKFLIISLITEDIQKNCPRYYFVTVFRKIVCGLVQSERIIPGKEFCKNESINFKLRFG